MADSQKTETKTFPLKSSIRMSLKKEMDAFVAEQGVINTQVDLVEYAIRFYMESFRKSGGLVNGKRFPLISAADVGAIHVESKTGSSTPGMGLRARPPQGNARRLDCSPHTAQATRMPRGQLIWFSDVLKARGLTCGWALFEYFEGYGALLIGL